MLAKKHETPGSETKDLITAKQNKIFVFICVSFLFPPNPRDDAKGVSQSGLHYRTGTLKISTFIRSKPTFSRGDITSFLKVAHGTNSPEEWPRGKKQRIVFLAYPTRTCRSTWALQQIASHHSLFSLRSWPKLNFYRSMLFSQPL